MSNPSGETPTHIQQPDLVLPVQFQGAGRKGPREAEHRLVIAMLQDAVECFQKHSMARDPKHRQLAEEAEEWIRSSDRLWPFSFENICELLDIDAGRLRSELAAWKKKARAAVSSSRKASKTRRPAEAGTPKTRRKQPAYAG